MEGLELAFKEIRLYRDLKLSAQTELNDHVALQLLKQKDSDVLVFTIPFDISDESRMRLLRILYNKLPIANIVALYPAIIKRDIFGVKTIDRYYRYQRIQSDCLNDVFYPKTTMYAIEPTKLGPLHFPENSGETLWPYLDQFKDEYFRTSHEDGK